MFWRFGKSEAAIAAHCSARYPGIVQRPGWIAATSAFGAASTASNIIFSNGEFDPWRSGGVLHNLSRTLVAIEVPQGAHHLDLMFSHPEARRPCARRVTPSSRCCASGWRCKSGVRIGARAGSGRPSPRAPGFAGLNRLVLLELLPV